MELSLTQRIFKLNKSFILFHTHSATREAIEHAINSNKSMDLDVCVALCVEEQPASPSVASAEPSTVILNNVGNIGWPKMAADLYIRKSKQLV